MAAAAKAKEMAERLAQERAEAKELMDMEEPDAAAGVWVCVCVCVSCLLPVV